MDFLLVRHSNLAPIMHHFGDMTASQLKLMTDICQKVNARLSFLAE